MATTTSWITPRPHPDGVEACIRDTNINVWGLVERRRAGMSDDDIVADVQGLTREDLQAADDASAQALCREREQPEQVRMQIGARTQVVGLLERVRRRDRRVEERRPPVLGAHRRPRPAPTTGPRPTRSTRIAT